MYCKFCGEQIADNAIFCHVCGKHLVDETKPNNDRPLSRNNIALLWWSLIMLTAWIFVYLGNDRSFANTLVIFPMYLGVILIAYTKKHISNQPSGSKQTGDNINNKECSLTEFAKKHGKMQICKFHDEDGVLRSKCIFTNTTEVNFDNTIGELSAQEISNNKNNLMVRYVDDYDIYVLSVKNGNSLIRMPSANTPPPLDMVNSKYMPK